MLGNITIPEQDINVLLSQAGFIAYNAKNSVMVSISFVPDLPTAMLVI